MENLRMKIGSNLPELLLSISQEHILNGDVEKGIETYTESLCGFTKEYALMILKNKAVLVVDEDEQTVNLNDDETLRMNNQDHIYDWNVILGDQLNSLNDWKKVRNDCKENFEQIHGMRPRDIENYSLKEMMLEYYSEDELRNGVGVHNLAAKLIKGDDFAWNQYGNGSNVWDHLCGNVESDDSEFYEEALYWTVEYVNAIRNLHKEFIKFYKLYHFLVENGLGDRIPQIENDAEGVCYILKGFSDPNKGYYHGMCNAELYDYKEKIIDDLMGTTWGKEYLQNNYIFKDIEDGYDAGWLSPEGEFIGANGETASMIHMYLAEDIWKGNSKYGAQMDKDGVTIYGSTSPERWLETHGWLKVHHDEIYGYFRWNKDPKEDDEKQLYCPTETQIELICKYVDKYYDGKFYQAPLILRDHYDKPLYTRDIKQMDEIALHNAFH
jgi:hypothetical protein